MGIYLNPNNDNFLAQANTDYYIDKTMLIAETNKWIGNPDFKFVLISRPRRFGKSIAEDMLAAYYSKGADSRKLFLPFKITQTDSFEKHLNKYNVIHIDLNSLYANWQELDNAQKQETPFMLYVNELVCGEFLTEFSDVQFGKYATIANYILAVHAQKKETFIIIIDEYDVLVREQVSENELEIYRAFLNSLFKSREIKPAISLAYLTGILPIMRDKIQSKLNTFTPYTMLGAGSFSEFVGFTAEEVKAICKRYGCDFELCKSWYDGYHLKNLEIYNPESVIHSALSGEFRSYWSGTSTYKVVAEKIAMNFAGTKEDVITMFSGYKVSVDTGSYDNTMTGFKSKDDVFTFLIHLGYLAYDADEQKCYIPNREVHNEWRRVIKNDSNYAETNKIVLDSETLLQETISGNEAAVAAALDVSHTHVTSNRSYNNEYSLQSAIYLAYIYAINHYIVTKEMTAGKGFADIVYIPFDKTKAALIIELKHNKSAETALTQIREKRYFESLSAWHGDVIFVGVNYDEKTKKHECKIERFVK